MHIQKFDCGDGFYATAWCGEKLGMLDRYYITVDNALKAIERKAGEYPCHQCLSQITQLTQKPPKTTQADGCQCVREDYFELTDTDGSKSCSGCGKRR